MSGRLCIVCEELIKTFVFSRLEALVINPFYAVRTYVRPINITNTYSCYYIRKTIIRYKHGIVLLPLHETHIVFLTVDDKLVDNALNAM